MQSRQRWLMCAVLLATCSAALRAQSNQPCAICDVLNGTKKKPKPVAQTITKNISRPPTPKDEAKETKEAKEPEAALTAAEVNALRDLVTTQQAQLEAQRQQLDQLKYQ